MKKIKRIETIFNQGTAKHQEDGFIINLPFVGVVDGVSAAWNSKIKPVLFDSMSGGEMTRKVILKTFYSARENESLEKLIEIANEQVGEIQISSGIPLERSDLLAGACFAITRLNLENIDIIQAGDCFALWVNASDKIGITKNQNRLVQFQEQKIIQKLMKKHRGDREKMWEEFYEPLCSIRQKNVNKNTNRGYGLLNGQPTLFECWQRIVVPCPNLNLLMFFTDGLIPLWLEYCKEKKMAKQMVALYREKGLKGILSETRKSELGGKREHTEHCEATGIAIEF